MHFMCAKNLFFICSILYGSLLLILKYFIVHNIYSAIYLFIYNYNGFYERENFSVAVWEEKS